MTLKGIFNIAFSCLFFNYFIQASHYVTKPLKDVQLREEDSQSIDARSPTECILKCQNQLKKKGFYTKDNACYCTNGTIIESTTGQNNSGLDGNLFLEREIKGFKSCNDVFNSGITENGFYDIEVDGGVKISKECHFDKRDCQAWRDDDYFLTGSYEIFIPGLGLKNVRCEMDNLGKGWISIQHRFDGSVDFHRSWEEYKNGFGDVNGEFWLGNEVLHQLTKEDNDTFQWVFKATAFDGVIQESSYGGFSIGSEGTNYLLTIGSLTNGMNSIFGNVEFTTYDRDNDSASFNCAFKSATYKNGGFWYSTCEALQPNGEYSDSQFSAYQKNIFWYNFRGYMESMKETLMMIRKT
ncbi:ficolin-1-like isoform X1 [Clytia hemisphaerica]|uniref:Fibrinogen C-terminal domain-containing protein n=1 Tax=Clytia hemisphaerica TaxID=252671 RepID=A0A7M5UVZ0_9CNID